MPENLAKEPTRQELPPYVRIYRFFGGISLVCQFPERRCETVPAHAVAESEVRSIADLASVLGGIVGVEFLTDQGQAEGTIPIEWRTTVWSNARTPWVVWNCDQLIARYMRAGFDEGRQSFARACWQLRFQLGSCEYHIQNLCQAYSGTLQFHTTEDKESGKWFTDVWTNRILIAVHSLLQEFAVLRDLLARIITRLEPNICTKSECDSMARLIRNWSDASLLQPGLSRIRQLVVSHRSEWLGELGDYRNCYVHAIPLHDRFSSTEYSEVSGVKRVSHYLPDDPKRWRREFDWVNLADQAMTQPTVVGLRDRFRQQLSTRRDALRYCHSVLIKFLELVETVLPLISPVEPSSQIPLITPIRGTLKWTQD